MILSEKKDTENHKTHFSPCNCELHVPGSPVFVPDGTLNPSSEEESSDVEVFPCNICSKQLSSRIAMAGHMRMKHGELLFRTKFDDTILL